MHLEILVEEPSAKFALEILLPIFYEALGSLTGDL